VLCRSAAPAERRAALEGLGVRVTETTATAEGTLDMADGLERLGAAGVTRVLCEGGGRLAASLLAAGLVDELVLFTGARVIGADGVPAVGGIELDRLAEAPGFRLEGVETLDGDVMSVWRPAKPDGASPAPGQ
jgi:diaminohydroxyphosphoribosylaminopyrimidine deaminase/5-amino-6-(5-phosphoribosylamino)uracil reductase